MKKLKKLIPITMMAIMTLSLSACTGTNNQTTTSTAVNNEETDKKSLIIQSLNANGEVVDLEVPYNPERIAILDMAALDIIDSLGMGERVVGSADTSLKYLQSYVSNKEISNLGTIKEADLEAVMASEPDIIFIGGRLSQFYDALSEIAPVVYLEVENEIGVVESVRKNAVTIASLFGLENQIEEKMAEFSERIEALSAIAKDKTAIVGMATSGSFNLLGNDGRASLIGKELGFQNLANSGVTSTHGNESSFELVVQMNLDYMFVLDRDAAIGTDGAKLAKEIVENQLVMKTDAYKNGNIIYFESPEVWYTAEGGISALDIMLSDLESKLLK